ncbi:hypothetical protein Tco_0535710 [Tanacetum coccineum]
MPPKKTSTSAVTTMTQAAIRQLITDSVAAALETQAANMASTDNPNRNIGPRETPKELLDSFASLNGLNQYFIVAIVSRKTKWHLLLVPYSMMPCPGEMHTPNLLEWNKPTGSPGPNLKGS